MFSVAGVLSLPQSRALLGGLTLDHTGLKGRYALELDYQFAAPRPAGPAARSKPSSSRARSSRPETSAQRASGSGRFRRSVAADTRASHALALPLITACSSVSNCT